ncbi:MAG: MFS transporter [Gammaproteobacteria bacterium]|nr:MFS transporter [Gammaproteobacteria bacterium]
MSIRKEENNSTLKLNYKRTFIIGFAFFGILLMWQVYDNYASTFLSELFKEKLGVSNPEQVQYLVGIMMAIDNIAALIMMPIFGNLSDKTNTKIGKRMPYILVGTFVCAVLFPFMPIAFHFSKLWALILLMAMIVFFAMMYRNPAVALMPDLTPKPLRSKANGIINIMGYIGGAVPSILGIFLVLSDYLGTTSKHANQFNNIWVIETPFLIASILMIVSVLVLFFSIKENKIKEEIKDELALGEKEAEIEDSVEHDDEKPMSKANKRMLIFILAAEFLWFMADNGISTFMSNYTIYYLGASTGSNMINTIVGGLMSVVGFAIAGFIVAKVGRKWTLQAGLGLTVLAYAAWLILSFAIEPNGKWPLYLYAIFAVKGFGMSLVHVNSFPMVVELCSAKKIGKFTGYYYASSMAAQSITPILLGLLLLSHGFSFKLLPLYALICVGISFALFMLVKSIKGKKTDVKVGLEALGEDD